MDIHEYFNSLSEEFSKAYEVAGKARAKGLDPKKQVEIRPAPDLASRVEGLTSVDGIADIIRKNFTGQSRTKLAFAVVKEMCTSDVFSGLEKYRRIETAVRVGSAILTEGVLVAPTEGIQGVRPYRNADGTDYIAVVYAGPIRGAGGTAAALSVALADYARRFFDIGSYKPTMDEIERYVEEAELYHTRAARLQYKPSDDDIRAIVANCPVCIDGVPTEKIEVGVHGNLHRLGIDGKEVPISNRVRGGIALVVCEGIAQKAKKLVKETKGFGLDWDWLNQIIKVEVKKVDNTATAKSVFLEDLAAGRPILAYPGMQGGFRLRYGRSRFTGIAAKGFSPATMLITAGFIAIGTQLKVEMPGKGCVALPVDSIEGPFVKLKSGECLRINDAETAVRFKDEIEEILAIGDILVTYGDFRKSNTLIQPSSYVEELWMAQLKEKGYSGKVDHSQLEFEDAYLLSLKYQVPLHPKFLFEFMGVSPESLGELALSIIRNGKVAAESVFEVERVAIPSTPEIKRTLELLFVPHRAEDGAIVINGGYAQSLLASLGFASRENGELNVNELVLERYSPAPTDSLLLVNSVAPFRLMKRATYIGARIGRPEKARERLMKPSPNVLFPISAYGGKDRNVSSAYAMDAKKFRSSLKVEVARYRCPSCKLLIETKFCYDCGIPADIEPYCDNCHRVVVGSVCDRCNNKPRVYEERDVNLNKLVSNVMRTLGVSKLPQVMKGVRGLTNEGRIAEPLEKGVLRATYNVHMFKDGTARFDATDVPITHFYPSEIGVSVERIRSLGYTKDYLGNELVDGNQLVELRHQDVILNTKGLQNMFQIAKFMDDLLERFYKLPRFYNATYPQDMIGALVITLSPHTSCGVLNRIIGVSPANVGFAHPYTISARRRNCDGDEDTTMLLMDALVNFSKDYLPATVGGTMDTPLILSVNIKPDEVDDEVHAMEVVSEYPLSMYNKSYDYASPSEIELETVENRLGKESVYQDIMFTHHSSPMAVSASPKKSTYTELKTMQEKVDAEFSIMDKLYAVNKRDAARRVITSHFIPDLIGNLHSFSRQTFRCSSCNAKFRRVPLSGKCTRDGGKLLLTISKGGIEKYLEMAIALAERYDLDPYIKQRLYLVRDEIDGTFVNTEIAVDATEGQFSLVKYF